MKKVCLRRVVVTCVVDMEVSPFGGGNYGYSTGFIAWMINNG